METIKWWQWLLIISIPLMGLLSAFAVSFSSRRKAVKKSEEKKEKEEEKAGENKKVQWHVKTVAYMASPKGKQLLVALAFLVGYLFILMMISQLAPRWWSRWMDAFVVFFAAQVLFIAAIVLRALAADKKVRKWPIRIMVLFGLIGLVYVGLGGKRSKEQIALEKKQNADNGSSESTLPQKTIMKPLPEDSYQGFFPISDEGWTEVAIPGCDSCDIRHDRSDKHVLMKDENGKMLTAVPWVKHGDHCVLYLRVSNGQGNDIVRLRPYNEVPVQ